MVGLCAGWCVDYVLGRVVFSGFFLSKFGVDTIATFSLCHQNNSDCDENISNAAIHR